MPRLDLGEIEDVVDEAEQVPSALVHAPHHVADLLGHLAVNPVEDQLGVAEDRIQRRAQLVAHVGEELRFVPARHFELAALVLDLVEQPHVLDRDCRLVGEGRNERDFLLAERLYSVAR